MRAIRCLNGLELPDITPEGKAAGKPPKALVVKVDEKTREFLDEFEATLGRSDVSPILVHERGTDDRPTRTPIHYVEKQFDISQLALPTPTPLVHQN
jgi:hypothetical protein